MGSHRQSLQALRRIALAQCQGDHPDLASLARELGSVVRCDGGGLDALAARVRASDAPVQRRLRTRRADLTLVLTAWPANYVSPLHDHGPRWGLEIPLHGALQIEAWQRNARGETRLHGRHWLGPGDALWFDADEARLHRCRNLSGRDIALSLHLYGGAPDLALPYAADAAASRPAPQPAFAPQG